MRALRIALLWQCGTDRTSETHTSDTLTRVSVFIIAVRFESEAIPGALLHDHSNPRRVRFGLYSEQMTASAFVTPRARNRNAYL